ncbi:hypothetical protein GYB59_01490 [bacterium]|nr:hypothetical protein [bacterium]
MPFSFPPGCRAAVAALALLLTSIPVQGNEPAFSERGFVTPNDFNGSDVERINQAIEVAAETGTRVVVPRWNQSANGMRNLWLLDSAILVRSNTVLEFDNCHVKLSDRCRDNFIRSHNCGLGITEIETIENVIIRGRGRVLLEGADRPRSTGDSAKTLGKRTYGSDAGKDGESQTGDWRNIGILLAHVEHFTIENLFLKDAHCWAISLERCAHGRVRDIEFDMTESRMIDGKKWPNLNQDGVDLRQGCRDITLENITGVTGDDLVALTNIVGDVPAGTDRSTMVSGTAFREGDDIRNIIIRNVRGHSHGGHHVVRLLNASGLKIHNVLIDGLIDTSPAGKPCKATLKIGDSNPVWGGVTPVGDTSRILINNVSSASRHTILIAGSLTDSVISNVIRNRSDGSPITYASGKDHIRNVQTSNLVQVQPAVE